MTEGVPCEPVRRWSGAAAGAAVLALLLASVLLSPAEAAAAAKALAGGPAGAFGAEAREGVETMADEAARVLAFGRPDVLIQSGLRLTASDPAPGEWHPRAVLNLSWTDLRSAKIRYDVFVLPVGEPLSSATLLLTAPKARANVTVPGDGDFTVLVRPRTDHAGRTSSFGPFLVDASPPDRPVLTAPAEPPGYRYDVSWTAVDDLSGILRYELQRRLGTTQWLNVSLEPTTSHTEDQIGNGKYEYRVRAVNGAGVPSAWSDPVQVQVTALMTNPGPGGLTYGIHANYTGILHYWDLSDPAQYVTLSQVPAAIGSQYLRPEPAIETGNVTLQAIVEATVGSETNTLRIAEKLFVYLYDHTDYDSQKASGADSSLQRAGETLDRGQGICGDLAVLYTTLLRIAGVPARPVHGYLDNALSGIGGFHMWVEVYVGPVDSAHPWMTVDVSGVTGTFQPEDLFPYFGIFNPDYLALGTELNYDRFDDGQWNTWARFRYVTPKGAAKPRVDDQSHVVDYDSELGRLFFDTATKRTLYRACHDADPAHPEDPCPNEPAPPGFSRYYGTKGLSKKRIDFGARLETALPSCLKVELRYPMVDAAGAVVPDQSAIYQVYENSASSQVQLGQPDGDGWVTFLDGTNVKNACPGV
jgi:transglutaminase-like putative cysteine protease